LTVIVPTNNPAYLLYANIFNLINPPFVPTGQSADLLNSAQMQLVRTLIAQGNLNAGLILATVPYTPPPNDPLFAQIQVVTTLGGGTHTPAVAFYQNQLPLLQQQAVDNLMTGPPTRMTAALILSTMVFVNP
jgi:hypothetical protein